MGRLPIPNSQKQATGSKEKPELRPGLPTKPDGLDERASAEWDRLQAELEEAGLKITVAHRTALTLAATIASDIAEAKEAVKKDGPYVMSKTGIVAHPATKRIDALRRDLVKVLTILGLRAPVSDGPTTPMGQEDPLDRLLD